MAGENEVSLAPKGVGQSVREIRQRHTFDSVALEELSLVCANGHVRQRRMVLSWHGYADIVAFPLKNPVTAEVGFHDIASPPMRFNDVEYGLVPPVYVLLAI